MMRDKIVENSVCKLDRQKSGNDGEDWNKQRSLNRVKVAGGGEVESRRPNLAVNEFVK